MHLNHKHVPTRDYFFSIDFEKNKSSPGLKRKPIVQHAAPDCKLELWSQTLLKECTSSSNVFFQFLRDQVWAERADLPIPRLSSRAETGAARSTALRAFSVPTRWSRQHQKEKRAMGPRAILRLGNFSKILPAGKTGEGKWVTSKQIEKC